MRITEQTKACFGTKSPQWYSTIIQKKEFQKPLSSSITNYHPLPTTIHYHFLTTYKTSLTKIPAIPWPVPTHMEVTKIFFLVLLSSLKPVTTCLVPVQPSGW